MYELSSRAFVLRTMKSVVVGGGEMWKDEDVMRKTPTGAGVRGQATHWSGAVGLHTSTGICERFLEEKCGDASGWGHSHRGGGRNAAKPYI
jgi:hypothetical protein